MGSVAPLNFPTLANAARRHLGWAVILSLLLHLLLIAGMPAFDWGPAPEDAATTLSARLAPLPPPPPPQAEASAPAPAPAVARRSI
ncbi:MAG TPA: hypothetical protein VF859_08380, partial [Burkholderiales bacterium]